MCAAAPRISFIFLSFKMSRLEISLTISLVIASFCTRNCFLFEKVPFFFFLRLFGSRLFAIKFEHFRFALEADRTEAGTSAWECHSTTGTRQWACTTTAGVGPGICRTGGHLGIECQTGGYDCGSGSSKKKIGLLDPDLGVKIAFWFWKKVLLKMF